MKNNCYLAELRCYEKSNIGINLSDCLSYVFIEKSDYYSHDYQNVFKDENYPVVKRNKINKNNFYYFEDNSSSVYEKYGDVGLCYVLTNISVCNLPIEDLKHIVLYSDHYFKDRKDLMNELYEDEVNTSIMSTIYDDYQNYQRMIDYLEEKGIDLENGGKKLVR